MSAVVPAAVVPSSSFTSFVNDQRNTLVASEDHDKVVLFYPQTDEFPNEGALVRWGTTCVDLVDEDDGFVQVEVVSNRKSHVMRWRSAAAIQFVEEMLGVITGASAPSEVRYVNLTPHVLNMVDVGDIEPSGLVARIEEIRTVEDGATTISLGGVSGLPAPLPGIVFVVARPLAVAMALAGQSRPDVVVVDRLVRNDEGVIVGAEGFARIV